LSEIIHEDHGKGGYEGEEKEGERRRGLIDDEYISFHRVV